MGVLPRRRAHFQTRLFWMNFVKNHHYVVIRVRPAPSFDQYGLLASTACTFIRRLMLIVFGCFLKNLRASAAGGPFWVARVVSLRPPAPLGRPGPQRQPRGTPRKRFGSSGVVSWKSPGPLWEASGPPKAPQSRSRDGANEASDLKLTQTKTSELKLHNFFPQGHWSSRAEAELAKRKQFQCFEGLGALS